jgi:dTDP-4-amino-4,6-dideoxygalactose transaminase
VDVAEGTYNPSVEGILAAASEMTKAVIVCHTYGVAMEGIERLAALCREKGWWLIEDVSECVGVVVQVRPSGIVGPDRPGRAVSGG